MGLPTVVLGFVEGGAYLALSAWIVWLGPGRGLHRALFLLLFFLGLNAILHAVTLVDFASKGTAVGLADRLQTYVKLALPFAAAATGVEFLHGHGRPLRASVRAGIHLALTLAASALLAANLLDRSLVHDGAFTTGPFGPLLFADRLAMAGIAVLLLATPRGEDARTIRVAAAAFLMEAVYASALLLRSGVAIYGVPGWNGYDTLSYLVVPGLVLAAAALAVVFAWRQDATLGHRYLALVLCAAGTSVLLDGLQRLAALSGTGGFAAALGDQAWPGTTLAFLWGLAGAITLAYAVLRCRFLRAELTARSVFRGGVAAAALTVLFFVAGQVLESLFNANSLVLNVAAGAAIAIALWPVQRGTAYLAHRLLDHVQDTPEYRRERGHDIYQHAARVAWRDGRVSAQEQRALARLGESLEISPSEMKRLESRVRALPGSQSAAVAQGA